MKIPVLALLITSAVICVVIVLYLIFGDGGVPAGHISNVKIWKHTPVWPLALAVKRQQVARITQLATAHPEWRDYHEPKYGATLLIWAVGVEKYQSAEALLDCGANPNEVTTLGETALWVAAGFSWVDTQAKQDPQYVKLLLKHGADPNICLAGEDDGSAFSAPGTSPLIESIGCGLEKTKALVEGGADINHQSASHITATIAALNWYGPNSTRESIEYAYYLIVTKKAKLPLSYHVPVRYNDEDAITDIRPIDRLRYWIPPLNSDEHRMKMEIVKEFARQGIDYWKTSIPADLIGQIKACYPNTWREYIKKY
jgi:hypothetical protein